ncbi:hypothetical protein PISMIDRAFT_434060 [Pisolithus microcarpus 441]|uniref:Unplaced genomic scaffold scaffold_388, whole genome shotgun sequence n=1 Tax=Pisolithus microcarpus 441 TaxID=765257 RepID=A0A0C9YF69_9AGAM|nr:hypothetical protein PISMIDRAFT_434060 [Pisolithus microcarpus 441]
MPPTSRVQVSPVSTHPAIPAIKSLTPYHATNIQSASEPSQHTSSNPCHQITHNLSCHQHPECK